MTQVREAQFRRIVDRGGQAFAEVEVFTDHPRDPQMLAYFRMRKGGGFALLRVVANDADTEIDWFDNALHDAFVDVTDTLLSSPDHLGTDDRDSFASQILAYPGVSEALGRSWPI
jgi:hypothetical protein